jgi:division protein CdvB (Snf7/Vps24/ESCRT-III family)
VSDTLSAVTDWNELVDIRGDIKDEMNKVTDSINLLKTSSGNVGVHNRNSFL